MLLTLKMLAAGPGFPVSTNSNYIAWNPFKYYISRDGFFISRDIDVLKAKLAHWDYWFQPHPFKNRFQDDFLAYESKLVDLHVDYELKVQDLETKLKKRRKIQVIIVPTLCVFSFVFGIIVAKR
jgi:hypothetical protein